MLDLTERQRALQRLRLLRDIVGNGNDEMILQKDPKLLMWYDQALARLGEEV
jgi:hypothetical protein